MASLNKVLLLGNLTRNPDLRFTPTGTALCEMGLAVSRKNIVNGKEQDEVCFVDITVWGKQAESCKQYLQKGSPVLVEGRLQFDQWDDKNGGGRRSKLRVLAERVQFMSSRRDGNSEQGGPDEDYGSGNMGGGNSYPQGGNYGANNGGNSSYSNSGSYNQNQNNYSQNQGAPAAYNNNAAPRNNQYQSQAPAMPPSMPEAAFNPNDEIEDDIPF